MGCGFSSGGGSDKDGGSGGTNSDEGERTGTAKSGIATDGAGDARTDAGQSEGYSLEKSRSKSAWLRPITEF